MMQLLTWEIVATIRGTVACEGSGNSRSNDDRGEACFSEGVGGKDGLGDQPWFAEPVPARKTDGGLHCPVFQDGRGQSPLRCRWWEYGFNLKKVSDII